MNYSRAIFLISEQVRCVLVTYEPDNLTGDKRAERVSYKTFDRTLKPGDYVVVPTNTRWGMTVCRIEAVDVEPDLETDKHMDWIIGKVNRADFEDITRQEDDAIAKIKSAEKRRKREELRKALLDDIGEREIQHLSITGSKAE